MYFLGNEISWAMQIQEKLYFPTSTKRLLSGLTQFGRSWRWHHRLWLYFFRVLHYRLILFSVFSFLKTKNRKQKKKVIFTFQLSVFKIIMFSINVTFFFIHYRTYIIRLCFVLFMLFLITVIANGPLSICFVLIMLFLICLCFSRLLVWGCVPLTQKKKRLIKVKI